MMQRCKTEGARRPVRKSLVNYRAFFMIIFV